MGQQRCTASQKATMRSRVPSSTAVMKDQGVQGPGAGMTWKPCKGVLKFKFELTF